jgi:hypothetical protein
MTTITTTDIETKKTKTVTSSLPLNEAIKVYSKLTKGRIVGNKIKCFLAERMVEITFNN